MEIYKWVELVYNAIQVYYYVQTNMGIFLNENN